MKDTNWYVIQIMSGKEIMLADFLKQSVDSLLLEDCFVPMTKRMRKYKGVWKEKEFILFPGYLFVVSNNINELNQHLKMIPEFTKVLGNEGDYILPLTQHDIMLVSRFINDDYLMEMSKGIIVNDRVQILSGPLMGCEGIIKKVDRHKRICHIEIDFCHQLTMMQVGLEVIDKIA